MLIPLSTLIEKYGLKINGILHIGASQCEEKSSYNELGITDDKIYWVEAMSHLVDRMKETIPTAQIYNAVISNVDGEERDFVETNNSHSSSLLNLKHHLEVYPEVQECKRYKVKTTRLQTLIESECIDMSKINFLNLDIQGMELEALKSLGHYIDQIDYVYTEVNDKELYEGCALFGELREWLEMKGFKVTDKAMMSDCGWGDAFFIRTK